MNTTLTLDFVRETIKEWGTAEQVRSNRIKITTTPEKIRTAIVAARDLLMCDRLVTMSSVDNGRTFDLIYHLIGPHRTIVSIGTELPRDKPEIQSMSDYLLPAGIYERQIHDLLGIYFNGHPDLKKLILNEDWPADEHPLRKDWKQNPDTYYGGINGERV
jgi:NADH:ubiquinone oxidoreductase subunit C